MDGGINPLEGDCGMGGNPRNAISGFTQPPTPPSTLPALVLYKGGLGRQARERRGRRSKLWADDRHAVSR